VSAAFQAAPTASPGDSFACRQTKAPQFGGGSSSKNPSAADALLGMFDAAKSGNIANLKHWLTGLNRLRQDGKLPLFDGQAPINVVLDHQLPLAEVPEAYRGKTLLEVASEHDQLRAVRFLLKNGAEVNPQGSGYPPLSRAVSQNREFIVNHLLQYRANPNRSNRDGDRPLTVALRNDNPVIVQLLRQFGAHNRPDLKTGLTPLEEASRHRQMLSLPPLTLPEIAADHE
jgi:hypothetical protein